MVKNMISLHTFNNMMDGGYQIVRLEQRNNSTLVYRIIWFRITIYCEMEFQKFPFDEQSCTLEVITRFPIPVTDTNIALASQLNCLLLLRLVRLYLRVLLV